MRTNGVGGYEHDHYDCVSSPGVCRGSGEDAANAAGERGVVSGVGSCVEEKAGGCVQPKSRAEARRVKRFSSCGYEYEDPSEVDEFMGAGEFESSSGPVERKSVHRNDDPVQVGYTRERTRKAIEALDLDEKKVKDFLGTVKIMRKKRDGKRGR